MDLAEARSGFQSELSDPRVRGALISLTHAEVGGQGPQAQQAFMESVFNRAAARGKSLSDTIYDRNYFPSVTHQRMAGGVPSSLSGQYGGLLDQVVGGSNVSNFATGNASGTVGFAGGPQTFAHGGERFGIEGPDRPWAQRMGAGLAPLPAPAASSSTAISGPRPMPTDYAGTYIPNEIIRQQQQQANNYWDMRPSGGKFSLAEGLMAGLGSTLGNAQAAESLHNNQRVRTAALADGTPTLASLLHSGVPEYQDMAAKMALQQASPQSQEELRGAKLRNDTLAASAPVDLALKQLTLEQGKNSFHQIGVDALGNPQYGFVDPVNRTVTPSHGGADIGGGTAPAGATEKLASIAHLHGDEWAKAAIDSGALPPRIVEEIKAYKDGRLPYNPTMAQKPRGQALTSLIMQYDPEFDAVNYASRNATRKDFTSGASAKNITSFNTAIGHLGHLHDAIDGLNNTGFPIVNAATNAIKRNIDPEFAARENKFNTARTAVTEELARAFKGMGATVTEVHEWEKKISSADSPQALKAAIQEGVALLQSRIDALGLQYNKGMGTSRDAIELLSPESRKTLEKLNGGGGHAVPKAASAPVAVATPEEARKLPKGTPIILPDGTAGVVP